MSLESVVKVTLGVALKETMFTDGETGETQKC